MSNVLPLSIRQASSISGFKMGVRDHLISRSVKFGCFRCFYFVTFW